MILRYGAATYDNYEVAAIVQIDGWEGIACRILGWETVPDEDTVWSGYESRTGNLVVTPIGCEGDTSHHMVCEPSSTHALDEEEFCSSCGQVGCQHDGR